MKNMIKKIMMSIIITFTLLLSMTGCNDAPVAKNASLSVEKSSVLNEFDFTNNQSIESAINKYPDYVITLENNAPAQNQALHTEVTESIQSSTKQYMRKDAKGRVATSSLQVNADRIAEGKGREQQTVNLLIPFWPKKNPKVEIESSKPGVKNYSGFLYNRSHLVADSLGGTTEYDNLIVGTRNQNVGNTDQIGGMRKPEIQVSKYMHEHTDNVVFYHTYPLYKNETDNIPQAVEVIITSKKGDLQAHYIVLNIAKGFIINYTDASSKKY